MRGNAKTAHINVRMTEEERAAIMTPSALMRESALRIGEKPARVADEATLRQILYQLKKEGGNLNQACHALNAYGSDAQISQQLADAVRLVSNTASQLSALLSKARE